MFRRMRHSFPHTLETALPLATADFRHVTHWIFDLDNTLYAADGGLMDLQEERIRQFVQKELGVDPAEAEKIQKRYFYEHGTTLSGLMRHHRIEPESYLSFVGDVDISSLTANLELFGALGRLPGKRFVFTNNCGRYAERILGQLGIAQLFHDIWDVRITAFTPKPARAAYDAIVAHADFPPDSAAMFDDLVPNLEAAHALGMTTVWLRKPGHGISDAVHIDHQTDDLVSFLRSIEVAEQDG